MEKEILMELGFVLTAPSAYRFLQRYRMLSRVYQDKEVFYYGQYILEVSLLDASLLQFKPSELAAAALILAATQLRKTSGWTEHMEKFTGYSKAEMQGRNCRFLQGPNTEGRMVREMVTGLRSAKTTTVNITNYRKDGSRFGNILFIKFLFVWQITSITLFEFEFTFFSLSLRPPLFFPF